MADIARNRQASYKFNFLETWEAGLQMQGSEVKSLRNGGVQLKDAFATVSDGEVWLHNMHIAPYAPASRENHDPERSRKLLLHKGEIERLIGRTSEKGLTLIPTRIYWKNGRAKIEIALARGKNVQDKRRYLKEKDARREIQQALQDHRGQRSARHMAGRFCPFPVGTPRLGGGDELDLREDRAPVCCGQELRLVHLSAGLQV